MQTSSMVYNLNSVLESSEKRNFYKLSKAKQEASSHKAKVEEMRVALDALCNIASWLGTGSAE